MAENVLGTLFGEIADAIREKTGDTATMKPAEFPEKISGIEAGGGGGSECRIDYTVDDDGNITGAAAYGFTKLPDYAFAQNSGDAQVGILSDIDLSGCPNLTSLGYGTFNYNYSITEFTIPDGVTVIPKSCFFNCRNLAEITLHNNITEILDSAFTSCRVLPSITIPASVTKIGRMVFNNTSTTFAEAIFEDPSGWYYTSNSDYTGGTAISSSNLSNAATAANYLRNTYVSYYWYKV